MLAVPRLVVAVEAPVSDTARQDRCTAAIRALDPMRASRIPPPCPSVSTQRTRPPATALASQLAETSLSRPEKPPSPATSAPEAMTALAAPCWLETATVPPPCASA